MANISVREKRGGEIVKALTGRDVPVVVDPTLLLSAAEWNQVGTSAVSKPSRPYLLTYFLGSVSPARQEFIDRIARERGLAVISLNTLEDLSAYTAGPSEFIDYVASADCVLTDSFHGAVFSIIYRRCFAVFTREGEGPSMNSRIESLLDRFGLSDQIYSQGSGFNWQPDYAVVDSVLDEERANAFEFLRASVGSGSTRSRP
jgi:hypothetical protein